MSSDATVETALGLDKEEFRRVAKLLDKNYSDEKYDADWACQQADKAAALQRYEASGSLYLQ